MNPQCCKCLFSKKSVPCQRFLELVNHSSLQLTPFLKGKGISSYSGTPEKAGESLKDCMEEAKKTIPKHRHQETPVYLGATAGMRLLKLVYLNII